MTFFLEDLHQADAQRTKVGSSLFAKVIWRCQKGMEPYMAFLEGGLGGTILWHPKNGSPQKTPHSLNRNENRRKKTVESGK